MPIVGITDTDVIELPWVAKIRKGRPKQTNRPGEDLNQQFRLQFAPGAQAESDRARFMQQFPGFNEMPVSVGRSNTRTDLVGFRLSFFFPFSEVEKQWDANIVCYRKGAQVARGNGNHWEFLRSPDGSQVLVRNSEVVEPHEDAYGVSYKRGDLRKYYPDEPVYTVNGRGYFGQVAASMNIMIPGYDIRNFRVLTSSWNDVYRISGMLRGIKNLCEQVGLQLAGVPLDLYRYPVEISKRMSNGHVRDIHWLWTVSPTSDWVAQSLTALSPQAYEHLLPSGQQTRRDDSAEETPNQLPSTLDFLVEEDDNEVVDSYHEELPQQDYRVPEWAELPDNVKYNDARSLYWALALSQLKMSPGDAHDFVNQFEGDWQAAIDALDGPDYDREPEA